MPMKATPTVPIVPHEVPRGDGHDRADEAGRGQEELGRDELEAVVDDHGDGAAGHPGADEDADREHDQDGRHGLVDAVDDAPLHVLPLEAEERGPRQRRERGRGDEEDLGLDLVDAVADAEEEGHGDERDEGDAESGRRSGGSGAGRGRRRLGTVVHAIGAPSRGAERAAGQEPARRPSCAGRGRRRRRARSRRRATRMSASRPGSIAALPAELVEIGRVGREDRGPPSRAAGGPCGRPPGASAGGPSRWRWSAGRAGLPRRRRACCRCCPSWPSSA